MTTMLAKLITHFFTAHLGRERNASPHTVLAYRDAFKMLLCLLPNFTTVPSTASPSKTFPSK